LLADIDKRAGDGVWTGGDSTRATRCGGGTGGGSTRATRCGDDTGGCVRGRRIGRLRGRQIAEIGKSTRSRLCKGRNRCFGLGRRGHRRQVASPREAMVGGHVQMDRPVRLAWLKQPRHDTHILAAGIEQNLPAGGGRVHGHVLARIHLRRGR
jgi:hypothetical protein